MLRLSEAEELNQGQLAQIQQTVRVGLELGITRFEVQCLITTRLRYLPVVVIFQVLFKQSSKYGPHFFNSSLTRTSQTFSHCC